MVQISITVEGLPQILNSMNKFPNTFQSELKKSLDRIANEGVKSIQKEAHVNTGKMKRGISKGRITNNQLEIISKEKYAVFENRRGGAHAFINKGIANINKIIQQEMNNAIKRSMIK